MGNRQENAPKKLTTLLSFGDSVQVQMFLSVLFTDDFLSSSVFKIVGTLPIPLYIKKRGD